MATNTAEDVFLQPPRSALHDAQKPQMDKMMLTIARCSDEQFSPVYREISHYSPLHTFKLPPGDARHYQQQYGDMYFLRLARLKPVVEEVGTDAWEGFSIAGERARRVERVLDVRQGELCWVAGTVYMDMPLKPNILDDLSRESHTLAPPPRRTYQDPAHPELTQIMLEDESGRLRLTGSLLTSTQLATGVIIAVLGTENANGDFETIDIRVPDLPPQPRRWERNENRTETKEPRKSKIAFVSGLGITGTSSDTLALELLADYLLGYTGSDASSITRLIIAGNSLGANVTAEAAATDMEMGTAAKKKTGPRKYGYDASAYNASPITQLDNFLAEILPSIPVTLMPGESDPANFALPQQGIHRAMFPRSRAYCAPPPPGDEAPEPGWFDSVTNPWEGDVEGWRLWGSSGQNVDDVLRYLDFADRDAPDAGDGDIEARMRIMEAMLRWRCGAPTAPDTIWSYPFQTNDPFVMQSCPHIFFAGNQPRFKTAVLESDSPLRLNGADTKMTDTAENPGARVRLLSIPKFKDTGELILVDSETLEVELVKFAISTTKVLLVPYSSWHVPHYHEWMKDEEIQAATASEPLTLEEEYAMQRSWRQDADKLTFIICLPVPRPRSEHQHQTERQEQQLPGSGLRLQDGDDAPGQMLGDINLFLRVEDEDEDEDENKKGPSCPQIIGEVELMIAEKASQRRGYGRAALLAFLRYVLEHEVDIVGEFVRGTGAGATLPGRTDWKFGALSVKIGKENGRSLALFESVGFCKVSEEPSYFGEFELKRVRKELSLESVDEAMARAGVEGYTEVSYERTE
ncbi:DNA polymerase delta subunit 2 [Aspergillus fumigatus Z5]|nr:DNA polymerase delta subunit 2 [Aspergillus fumigatus Z5]